MCREPVMRAPFSGCSSANSARSAMRPGISCSASSISLRPNAARDRSATLKSSAMILLHEGACDVRSWAGTNWPARDSPTGCNLTASAPSAYCDIARYRSAPSARCARCLRRVPAGPRRDRRRRVTSADLPTHRRLDVVQHRDGSGVDPFLRSDLEAGDRSEEDEVEQLCEGTVAFGAYLLHPRHDLFGPLAHELEAPHHLRVLAVVT